LQTYLGTLCKRSHSYLSSSQSLRVKSNNNCVECLAERNRAWKKSDRGKLSKKRARHQRRALTKSSSIPFTSSELINHIAKFNSQCCYCGCGVKEDYHLDHVTPLSIGGLNSLGNLAIACVSCNLSKGARGLEWYQGSENRLIELFLILWQEFIKDFFRLGLTVKGLEIMMGAVVEMSLRG